MRASAPFLLVAMALAAPVRSADAPAPVRSEMTPPPAQASVIDPDIKAIVSGISAERIQRSIFVLASFKTRHTLSDPLPSGDGIGGAASWIRAEFDRASAQAGGGGEGGPRKLPPAPPPPPQPPE